MSRKRSSIEASSADPPAKRRSSRIGKLSHRNRQRALLCDYCYSIEIPDDDNESIFYSRQSNDLLRDAEAGCGFCEHIRIRLCGTPNATVELKIKYGTRLEVLAKVYGSSPQPDRATSGETILELCRVSPSLFDNISEKTLARGFYCLDFKGIYADHDDGNDSLYHSRIPRIVSADPLSEASVALVRKWFQECSQHTLCRPVVPRPLPSRLVDVRDPQRPKIAQLGGSFGFYTILSHCWGSVVDRFPLTADNIEQYLNRIEVQTLPRNFRDAMEYTRVLGYDYIWIDGLCIMQRDQDDWAFEAAKMADYYSNAVVTLSATDSLTCHDGFLHRRFHQYSAPIGQDQLFCLRNTLRPETLMDMSSPVSRRAWTLQERLLSPRLIHFTKDQLRWACGEQSACEAYLVPPRPAIPAFCGKRSYEIIHKEQWDLHQLEQHGIAGPLDVEEACRSWYECISEYSTRFLSRQSDKLAAVAGLASKFAKPELGNYLAGLWEVDIGRGLAWRRLSLKDGDKADVSYLVKKARGAMALKSFRPPLTYRAPSWSWASQNGPLHIKEYSMFGSGTLRTIISSHMQYELQHWQRQYGPKLRRSELRHTTASVYIDVQEGSYIEIEGFCRDLWIHRGQIDDNNDPPLKDVKADGPDGPFVKELILDQPMPGAQMSCFLERPSHLAATSLQQYLMMQICKEVCSYRLVYALLLAPKIPLNEQTEPDDAAGNATGVQSNNSNDSIQHNTHNDKGTEVECYTREGLVELACYNLCEIPKASSGVRLWHYVHPKNRFGGNHYDTREWQQERWTKKTVRLY